MERAERERRESKEANASYSETMPTSNLITSVSEMTGDEANRVGFVKAGLRAAGVVGLRAAASYESPSRRGDRRVLPNNPTQP